MKIYTKTGDDGTTSLIGGTRVSKCNDHLEIYGTLDELNSFIGLLKNEEIPDSLISELEHIQNNITKINACFACPDAQTAEKYPFDATEIEKIEKAIDCHAQALPPIENFLTPGTSKANAVANICRTVCRRAERNIYKLDLSDNQQMAAVYINRLSDYLFMVGRMI